MKLLGKICAVVFAVATLTAQTAFAFDRAHAAPPPIATRALTAGAIASPDRYGALAAEEILKRGGNAVDAAVAKGREMADIDRMLSSLFDQRWKLLAELPEVAANDPTGVAAKIAVAARAVDPEDHEEAHNLIAGAARDLANMRCPDCHRPLVLEGWIDWSIRTGRE